MQGFQFRRLGCTNDIRTSNDLKNISLVIALLNLPISRFSGDGFNEVYEIVDEQMLTLQELQPFPELG